LPCGPFPTAVCVCVYLLVCPVDLWHFNLDLSVRVWASGKVCVVVVVVGQATLRVGESGDTCTYESNDFVRMATRFSRARPLDDTLPSAPFLDGVGVPTQPLSHTHRNARTHTQESWLYFASPPKPRLTRLPRAPRAHDVHLCVCICVGCGDVCVWMCVNPAGWQPWCGVRCVCD
jgi:hypothetical protein